MTKEQQDLAWACLPKEAREDISYSYKNSPCGSWSESLFEKIYGEHNLTSDTEPEEMLMVSKKRVMTELCRAVNLQNDSEEDWIRAGEEIEFTLTQLFGDKCMPDKEESTNEVLNALEHYRNTVTPAQKAKDLIKLETECLSGEELLKPKFKVGDKVKFACKPYDNLRDGKIATIQSVEISPCGIIIYSFKEFAVSFREEYLEPYTEEKELNLCELLKDCEGEIFYCPFYGEVELTYVNKYSIGFRSKIDTASVFSTNREGLLKFNNNYTNIECVVFPSKELYEKYPLDAYASWMEWKDARKPKRWRAEQCEKYWRINVMGEVVIGIEHNIDVDNGSYDFGNYFRTEEEAKQAREIVKDALQKFNEQNM